MSCLINGAGLGLRVQGLGCSLASSSAVERPKARAKYIRFTYNPDYLQFYGPYPLLGGVGGSYH